MERMALFNKYAILTLRGEFYSPTRRRPEGASGRRSSTRTQSLRCVPSQNGLVAACLQPHIQASLDSVALYSIGRKLVTLCEPSQNGWFLLRPQAHHQ